MEHNFYTDDKGTLILLALLKQYGIKRVIASPGTGNMALVVSMQHDPYFEMYSCVDERSAAYMACGMAAEAGEPVVITCTEATASRNYLPGMTEAFYRKLPVLVIMTGRGENRAGSYEPQSIDNAVLPKDVAKYKVNIPVCRSHKDERIATTKLNEAINNLYTNGGGPVCVVMESYDSLGFLIKELPKVRVIKTYKKKEELPPLPKGNIAILVGAHQKWNTKAVKAIEFFCEKNNAVVLCDLTSNYNGKYRLNYSIVTTQEGAPKLMPKLDLLIYVGTVCGDYYTSENMCCAKEWWMVNEDGQYHDRFNKLTAVITMEEADFFENYVYEESTNTSLYEEMKKQRDEMFASIPELPFSNLWIAQTASKEIPENCVVHAAINNSFRSWNYFPLPNSVTGSCNVGGFGIDGGLSTLVGASLVHPDKLYFGIIGDLAFFYDMNALGNRHIGNNLRLLLVNNGKGQEFRNYQHPASLLGDDCDKYVAAGGHYGEQSPTLVKAYAESMGFRYLTASSKEDFLKVYKDFFNGKQSDKPMVFEVFTDNVHENEALHTVRYMIKPSITATRVAKEIIAKGLVGEKGVQIIKTIKKNIK